MLAFVEMLNDYSGDTYLYDYFEGGVRRLIDAPGYSYDLEWAPDGFRSARECPLFSGNGLPFGG